MYFKMIKSLTPVTMVAIKKTNKITSIGKNVENLEPVCTHGGVVKWCICCGKQHGCCTEKLKIELSGDPVVPLLGI